MASAMGFLRRNWLLASPPTASKSADALKFGILGAANIAPLALITPAKSHPDVIIYAVAARDEARAVAFAQKYGIPVVKNSYEELLDDVAVDVVYIPLPIGLHCEWALRALSKGKHVLLEKASTCNAAEAERLFGSELLLATPERPEPPVLMEAFHNRFSPSWACFMAHVDRPNVSHVFARAFIPSFLVPDNDIRFNYDLGGGSLLDMGTYAIAALREVFGTEPEECEECEMDRMPAPRERCDANFKARFRFPGGVGEIEGGFRGSGLSWPTVTVTQRPVLVEENGENTTVRKRRVSLVHFLLSAFYHRIEIEDEFVTTNNTTGKAEKRLVRETKKAYTFREMGSDQEGEVYWHTYRYMLAQFCRRIRGHESTAWVSNEDSVAQMRAVDMAYEKSGLGSRPTTKFALEK